MLKKILLVAAVAVTASFAQINFGVHAGLDMSTLWDDGSDDVNAGIGFNAGAAVKVSLPMLPITLAPEVLIDMRNYNIEDLAKTNITQWNIDVPVLVRFSPLPILYLEAGPQLSFNLAMSAEDEDGNEDKIFEDMYQTNTFEFDLVFGVGTGIVPFVDIDFRVNLGMTETFDEIETLGLANYQPKMASLQFALGATYWF